METPRLREFSRVQVAQRVPPQMSARQYITLPRPNALHTQNLHMQKQAKNQKAQFKVQLKDLNLLKLL